MSTISSGPKFFVMTRTYESGAGQFGFGLARGLASCNVDVTLFAPPPNPVELEVEALGVKRFKAARGGYEARSFRDIYSKILRIFQFLYFVCSKIFERGNKCFIFTIAENEYILLPIILMLNAFSIDVIYVAHDPFKHDLDLTSPAGQLHKRVMITLYRHCHNIVGLSETAYEIISAITGRPVHHVPIGMDPITPDAPYPGERLLLAFGSVRRNKHVLDVIEGVRLARDRVPGLQLMIVGDGRLDDPYVAACAAAAAEAPGTIIFDPRFIADAELPALLARVDAFVLAYGAFESQSGVAALAGLAGRPVISSYAGGIRELLSLGLVGVEITRPVTPAGIADAIARYYETSAADWSRAASTGAQKLANVLSWEAVAPRYIQLLQSPPSGSHRNSTKSFAR